MLQFTSEAIHTYGYWLVFGGSALEATFVLGTFVPGLGVLVLGGMAAGVGELDLLSTLVAAYAGTVCGDLASFALGRTCGHLRWIQNHLLGSRFIDAIGQERLGILLFYQFPPASRAALPTLLGASGFSAHRFITLTLAGSVLFCGTAVTTGYFVGLAALSLGDAQGAIKVIQGVFFFLFVLWIFALWRRTRAGRT